jgi:transposase-like protein
MARRADQGAAARWRERLERFQSAPMSVAQFCRLEGVSQPSFYQWRRRLAMEHAGGATADAATSGRAFAPVRLIVEASVAAWLPGGTKLEIPLGDAAAARIALETIVRADAERAASDRPAEPRRQGGASC